MRNRKTIGLIWVLPLAVLSVVGLQALGINRVIELRGQIFDKEVARSLTELSEGILVTANIPFEDLGQIADANFSDNIPLNGPSRKIVRFMEQTDIDSILHDALRMNGVEAKAVFGVFDKYGQPEFLDQENEPYREDLVDFGYSYELGDLEFRVFFPERNHYLHKDGLAAFGLSGLLLLIIFVGLVYVYYSVKQAKQIENIRRDLMNNLTHELKTPISTIGLASEALSDSDIALDADQKSHYVGLIKAENKRLGLLVQKVLQASLVETGALKLYLQPLNIHDVVKEAVKNVAMQVRKQGGKIDVNLKATNPIVSADKTHITNIIFNLIDNALKYSTDKPKITISTTQTSDGVVIMIRDNGIGIPKEHLGKVFERLYRVPTGNVHDVKGFGLGLSYVKHAVERHGGSIDVESELGEYSVFTINLKHDPEIE